MTRYANQHSRKAFGPTRLASKRQLATYIVASIREHGAKGVHRHAADYTPDVTTQQLVNDLLLDQQW